ncbi:MAG: YHYH protein [Gammaproteobacteria bacterium]|jgi:hypothetical protein|nr:hypothetical protein [Chromatiales bacterium]MDP6673700.1 YHYH protein [Gammaproteobacteria bacterium]
MRTNTVLLTSALIIGTIFISGCGSNGSTTDVIDGTSVTTTTSDSTIDITNVVFDERSADCADYVNGYTASVLDIGRSLGFSADIVVTNDDDSCTLTSNNIPNHDFNDASASFATLVSEVSQAFAIPRNATLAATPTPLSQQTYNGIMLNGVPIDILSAGCYSPSSPGADADGNVAIGCTVNDGWLLDPLSTHNHFGADAHNAHTQPNGSYHYHGNPNAMFDEFAGPNGSPAIGFAADGFPIYGCYFYDQDTGTVRKALSGYTLKPGLRPAGASNPDGNYDGSYRDDWEFTDAGDLDECNGMETDGQYGYYVIDAYPWILSCFSGTPHESFNK